MIKLNKIRKERRHRRPFSTGFYSGSVQRIWLLKYTTHRLHTTLAPQNNANKAKISRVNDFLTRAILLCRLEFLMKSYEIDNAIMKVLSTRKKTKSILETMLIAKYDVSNKKGDIHVEATFKDDIVTRHVIK